MTMIVDANGPLSSRPGLTKVLEAVTAAVTAPAANGHAAESATPAELHDFAPPTDPDRMRRLTNLTGQMIREACKGAGKAVLDLVDEAEREIEAMAEQARAEIAEARKLAQEFDLKVNKIGGANADGIEEMLSRMQSVHLVTAAVRTRVTELTESYSNPQAGKAA